MTAQFSVVIPSKNSGNSIRATVDALNNQDYPGTTEIIVVGDMNDSSWEALKGVGGNLIIVKTDILSPRRDANMKRSIGLSYVSPKSDILAIIDSDVVVGPDWMALVAERLNGDIQAVAGPVSGIIPGFWTDYIDKNPAGSKTPRITSAFVLDKENIGHKKPPVTANFAMTKEVYEQVGGPDPAFTNSYEDYEWFSRMVRNGYGILCDSALDSVRYHLDGFRPLLKEYLGAGRGCADYIYTYFRDCSFAKRRVLHLIIFYLMCVVGLASLIVLPLLTVSVGLVMTLVVAGYSAVKVGRINALSYPFITALLGTMFVYGLSRQLLKWQRLVEPTVRELHVQRS